MKYLCRAMIPATRKLRISCAILTLDLTCLPWTEEYVGLIYRNDREGCKKVNKAFGLQSRYLWAHDYDDMFEDYEEVHEAVFVGLLGDE